MTPNAADWAAFWAMGGHGFYVWGSVGAVALFVAVEMLGLRLSRRAVLARLAGRSRDRVRAESRRASGPGVTP